jgi:two-component system, NarL family, sensor histidine kinase UhpB
VPQRTMHWMRRFFRRILGVPLIGKLIGANALIVASAALVHGLAFTGQRAELLTVFVALTSALAVNVLLVHLALQPVVELEELAERVSRGEFDARGAPSLFADRELAHLRDTINGVLDSLAVERKWIQELGAQVVRAEDVERANVSRELHDSIAQTLAAVRFQLAAASREESIDEMRNRLAAVNGMISAAMEQIMTVSNSLHSRVAEDLGIEAALDMLARQVKSRSGIDVKLRINRARPGTLVIPPSASATLYRVAEEALRNVELNAQAESATIDLSVSDASVQIEVVDDSNRPSEDLIRPGLISVKDRVLLAGGKMKIDSAPAGGMRVKAELRTMRVAS